MKITGIAIGPSGFSSVLAPTDPPGPLPDPAFLELALLITNRIYDETEETYSAVQTFDPVTFALKERRVMTDEADSYAASGLPGSGAYVLCQAKRVGTSVYVLAKAGFSYVQGDPVLDEDIWGLMEFVDPATSLLDRVLHPIGSSEGDPVGLTFIYSQDMLAIIDDVAYINVVPLDSDTNEPLDPDLDPPIAGLYGYSLEGGADVFRNNHGTSEIPPRNVGVANNGSLYTVGETEADSAVIYKGTPANPFATVWFNDASIVYIWSIIAINRVNDHVFCWAIDVTGPAHPALFFVLELDADGEIVQSIDVTTTMFTIDAGIPGPGCISNGKLYVTIYLRDDPDPTEEIADGVWVINISDASGADDPAFIIGEDPPTDDGFFNIGIINGIEMVSINEESEAPPDDEEPPPELGDFLSYEESEPVHITGETDVEISEKSFIGHHINDAPLIIDTCTNVYLHDIDFDDCSGGILVVDCTGQIRIEDIRGRNIGVSGEAIGSGRHNLVQLGRTITDGSGSSGVRRVQCYGGDTEDMISIFESGGLGVGQELIVEDNILESPLPPDPLAWTSSSGSGIMLADSSGEYIICRNNELLRCGQVGIGCAKGEHVEISENILYGEERDGNNVGIGVGFVAGSPNPGDISVIDNRVLWVADGGTPNSYYDGGNSGTIDESGNTFDDGTINPATLHVSIPHSHSDIDSGFVSASGTSLILDGVPFRYLSYNSTVLSGGCGIGDQNPTEAEITAFFASLRPNSLVRTWFFSHHDRDRLDYVVNAARDHGQKLIVVLTDASGQCGDVEGPKDESWYESGYEDVYLPYVLDVVDQYKDDVAIGMWELINEPTTSDNDTLRAFFDAVGGAIHAIDSNHLVESGTFPPWAYDGESGWNYIHASDGIDVCSMHEYDQIPGASGHLAGCVTQATALGKPIIIGESGILASETGNPTVTFNGYECVTFEERIATLEAKLDDSFAMDIAGFNYWNWYPHDQESCRLETYPTDALMDMIHDFDIP